MTFSEGRDAILAIFKQAWDTLGLPVVYEDITGAPPTNENVWARPVVRHADGNLARLGKAHDVCRYEELGIVIIDIFAPVGDGWDAAYNAAQPVADAYRTSKHSSLWFRNVRLNEVGKDGAYVRLQVLANFSYDSVR